MITSLPWKLTALVIFALAAGTPAYSDVFSQENFKTHLRWNLVLPKEQVNLHKDGRTVRIETLDLALFERLAGEITKAPRAEGYLENVTYSQEGYPAKPATITLTLKDQGVELFSFYRDVERKWIMDFWVNSDRAAPRTTTLQKLPETPVVAAPKKAAPPPIPAKLLAPKKSLLDIVAVPTAPVPERNPGYRDFRYGASFLWPYPALLPPLERDVQLASKVPEFLYPVKDRELLDDPKEAHVQLSVNLYRKEKWGLLNKSLELYKKKYGTDANQDTNDWMRVNALFKSNLTRRDRTLQASAMNLLGNILDRTTDYEMKRAAFRYLLQYQVDQNDWFRALETSKKFFVEARGQFDHDMVVLASQVILQALARLRQTDKISEFLADKKLAALLPPQTELAFATHALLSQGRTAEVLKRFRAAEKGLAKPVHPAILYNAAESAFQEADYETAQRLFDAFAAEWSHLKEAAPARLRLALIWDLLERPVAETEALYKRAIDRSPYPEYRYEAKLRYVGLRLARKTAPDAADAETDVFLDQAPDEQKAMTAELKTLLWLVRLRVFINRKQYDEALAYMATLPVDTLKPAERRVFDGDGAEIVFGLIQQAYLKEDYAKAVKIWEVYKDRWEKRVAVNPYMNFVVADSFIKLGLYKSFDRAYSALKSLGDEPPREFPIWVERTKTTGIPDILEELAVIKHVASQEWDQAEAKLASFPVSRRDSVNYAYYRGLVAYHRGRWQEAGGEFEKVLLQQNPQNRLTPRQMADLLMGYVESLYNLKDLERFKTVVVALARDTRQSKSASILNVAERVNYLLVESLVGDDKPEWGEVETLTREFAQRFQKSPYSPRIEYLLGLSLLRGGKLEEGKNVLKALLGNQGAPGYVREMARTELSALELKSKQL